MISRFSIVLKIALFTFLTLSVSPSLADARMNQYSAAQNGESTANAAPVMGLPEVDLEKLSKLDLNRFNTAGKPLISNFSCDKCHAEDGKYEDDNIWKYADGTTSNIFIDPDFYENSVHGKLNCNACHVDFTLSMGEHDEQLPTHVDCQTCHALTQVSSAPEAAEAKAQAEATDEGEAKTILEAAAKKHKHMGAVLDRVDSYKASVHAQAHKKDPSKPNAYCYDCHDVHQFGSKDSDQRVEFRNNNPEICGQCHEKEKKDYMTSIHWKELSEKGNKDAPVCMDCHTSHDIVSPKQDSMKLTITKNCGSCHEKAEKTYLASYHGQVHRLGYTYTAKCYDCHGSHGLQKTDDPVSKVHMDNRLKTCQTCHKDAPQGFETFEPHGHAGDFERYPGIWIATKSMQVLIIGVFLVFWTHVLLWLYREAQDRRQGKGFRQSDVEETVYVRRFTTTWRVIHLLFAMSTMTLVLTGSTLLFAHTAWANFVIDTLGGPKVEGIIHRTAATIWLSVFITHFAIAMYTIFVKRRGEFRWFGPTSMLPRWQDLWDLIAMFKWFFGMAERPQFDRWSYWQKFDYWAPFWGVGVIGFSGAMLFFPTLTATVLPGWVFNIATIVHAEEALLATMFLFTVHFFNAHFRPEKFPMSTTIFTGAVPLEEFKHEHKLEYERLEASGELDKYLVNKPSKGMQMGSNMLAILLILAGLTLLTLVSIGMSTAP